jgi:hypothetical protein
MLGYGLEVLLANYLDQEEDLLACRDRPTTLHVCQLLLQLCEGRQYWEKYSRYWNRGVLGASEA